MITLIEQGKYSYVRKELIEMNVVDIARLFEEIDRQ